jgi:YHS domain-containing protein
VKAKTGLSSGTTHTRSKPSRIVVISWLMLTTMQGALATEFRTHELIVSDPVTGAAILGFDPVAYQLDRAPRAGSAAHQLIHAGKVWYFASEANRQAFRLSPEDYVPAFGGHDPVAVAAGLPVGGNPTFHAFRNGRLYLFRTAENRATFVGNPDIVATAERLWPEVKRGLSP